jgi:hypothetical protein
MSLSDPVPSTALDVLKRNAEDFDKFVNGTDDIETRTGDTIKPLSAVVEEAPEDGNFYLRKDGGWIQYP